MEEKKDVFVIVFLGPTINLFKVRHVMTYIKLVPQASYGVGLHLSSVVFAEMIRSSARNQMFIQETR